MNKKKLIHHSLENQELIAIFNNNDEIENIYVYRKNQLNFNDIVNGKIISFHPRLKGYFVETEKGKNVFVPSNETLSEGTNVIVHILKEPRKQKEATGEFIKTVEKPYSFIEEIKKEHPFPETEISSLEPFIEEALEEKITFLNGASLTIQKTEALWSIDVDSGSSTHETTFINKSSVQHIFKQVQLKNMSGMILIDFIGSKRKSEKEALLKEIKQAFKNDFRTKIYSFSSLNLLEIKRKSQRSDVYDLFLTKNNYKHPLYVSYLIDRKIKNSKSGKRCLTIHPTQEKYLTKEIKQQTKIHLDLNVQPDYFELKEF